LGSSQWWRRGLQHRWPGVRHLPSLLIRAGPPIRTSASPDASILTTAEHRRRGHFTMAPHGSVAPWGAAGGNPAVFRHRGFDSSPTHEQQCASRLTGRAPGSYPGEDWVRGPGRARAHAAVAQLVRATACRAEGHGFESRRWRAGRRSPMERAPAYEAGGCRFDPCRRRHLAVAQWREHRPPKAGVARSNRAGEAPGSEPAG
jgi:hypothetical protein